jgi:hypothetical protein
MPPGFSEEGLRAAVALRKANPGLAVLVLSQYIEKTYAGELLDSGDGTGVGYLLKDRVGDVAEFTDALMRLDLPPDDHDHRRVLAVLSFLRA